jgi:hypothetical protein
MAIGNTNTKLLLPEAAPRRKATFASNMIPPLFAYFGLKISWTRSKLALQGSTSEPDLPPSYLKQDCIAKNTENKTKAKKHSKPKSTGAPNPNPKPSVTESKRSVKP